MAISTISICAKSVPNPNVPNGRRPTAPVSRLTVIMNNLKLAGERFDSILPLIWPSVIDATQTVPESIADSFGSSPTRRPRLSRTQNFRNRLCPLIKCEYSCPMNAVGGIESPTRVVPQGITGHCDENVTFLSPHAD